MKTYQYFSKDITHGIAQVAFNRPDKSNALNADMWKELKAIFEEMHETPEARVVILSGEGKNFCAGIDLEMLMTFQYADISCEGRKREKLRDSILHLQSTISAIEKCRKPVLAAIHRACIGGGVDIISACDMRYCTDDAYFSIREVDMGLVADIGTTQRLPKIIGPGIMAELAYTGRNVGSKEAREIGLVNRTFSDKGNMMKGVTEIAAAIAAKSPLVVRGIKEILLYTRDHSVEESLNYIATWNAGMLVSEDLTESFQAFIEKRKPVFND